MKCYKKQETKTNDRQKKRKGIRDREESRKLERERADVPENVRRRHLDLSQPAYHKRQSARARPRPRPAVHLIATS
jgi:hypothetical protein